MSQQSVHAEKISSSSVSDQAWLTTFVTRVSRPEELNSLLLAMGVDAEYDGYPELIHALLEILKRGEYMYEGFNLHKLIALLEEAAAVLSKLKKEYPPLAKKVGSRNPLKGEFQRYPVISCCLEPCNPEVEDVASVLRLIPVIASLYVGEEREVLKSSAMLLRRAISADARTPWASLLVDLQGELPNITTPWHLFQRLLIESARRSEDQKALLQGLTKLRKFLGRAGSSNLEVVRKHSFLVLEGGGESGISGELWVEDQNRLRDAPALDAYLEDDDDRFTGESPTAVDVVEVPPVEDPNEPEGPAIADFRKRWSGGWLQRSSFRHMTSRGLFNEIERRWLVDHLEGSVGEKDLRKAALLVGLSISMSLGVDAVCGVTLGSAGCITSSGTFRRRMPKLPNAAEASPENRALYRQSVDMVEIPLPDLVRRLVEVDSFPIAEAVSVGEWLGLTKREALSKVSDFLEILRRSRSRRFRIDVIHTQLKSYALGRTRDPALAYALFGQENELPPIPLYYRAIDIAVLSGWYARLAGEYFLTGNRG